MSGGLDSILAVKCILEQGIRVIPIHFLTPFLRCSEEDVAQSSMKRQCREFGLELKIIRLDLNYLEMVKNPGHGHGRNLNPCIDCKILFLKEARKVMDQEGASFVFTGEVIGQRPMSQHLDALRTIEQRSGLEGLLLRPLSARLLPPSLAEKNGWVDRQRLHGISGRSRKEQIQLAASWGIRDFPTPGGGCLLTERFFCARLQDLIDHGAATPRNCEMLKFGRFFRISPSFFLVVGRNRTDNEALLKLADPQAILLEAEDQPGPTAVGIGRADEQALEIAMAITARYTAPQGDSVWMGCTRNGEQSRQAVKPLEESRVRQFLI